MKTLSPALAAHLASAATTMAYCWRVTRHDGMVLGFTEHDRDVVYAGTIFSAASGFTASQIAQGLGLSVDNMEAQGALSSGAMTEADILAGRFDDAAVELFWVNWADPTQGVTIAAGNLGEVKRAGVAFSAEFRSLANRLNQRVGWTYGRTCSATLGDGRCGVGLAAWTANGQAQTAGVTATIAVAGYASLPKDFFSAGTLLLPDGHNAGLTFEIKAHLRTAGADILELWLPVPFPVVAGETVRATAGCHKTATACRAKFNNIRNFRGFPFIPNADAVTRYATDTAAAGADGGADAGGGGGGGGDAAGGF